MSLIYLVQSGGSLDGADGYSYGLLNGEHHRLLVSFVDFMNSGRQTIHKKPTAINRRPLTRRATDPKEPTK